MKRALMALDGGGSNLRILVVDKETDEVLFSEDIQSGSNLSTVPDEKEALSNIRNLITKGAGKLDREYHLEGICLSSAGTEIEENKKKLEGAIEHAIQNLKIISNYARISPPKYFVTNDIEVLLNSSDMALVAGTGTVGAVKYKEVETEKDAIYKLDGNAPYIGDKGSGYWIAKEVLTKVAEIENLGGFMNSKGEFVEVSDSYLKDLVYRKIFAEKGIDPKEAGKVIKEKGISEFVSLVYDVTQENGKPFGRAKVGNLFSKIADDAAYMGDEAANDILKQAAMELFKNVRAGYQKGNFDKKEYCDLLLSGSVLVHSNIVRTYLENEIKDNYPNVYPKVNKEKPVWSTIRFLKDKLEPRKQEREER